MPKPHRSPSVCRRDPERPRLRLGAQRRRELVDCVLGAHDLPEHGAVLAPEGDGDAPALPVPLDVEHHVREEHAHLAVVDLAHHRVVAEVDCLDGVNGIGEHRLPVGAHVHARVVDGRLHDREGRPDAPRVVHRTHALGLHPAPVPVEAGGHDPVRALGPTAFKGRRTWVRRTTSMRVALRCFARREERPARATAQVQLHLVDGLAPPERPRDERALGHALLVPRERHRHLRVVAPHAHLSRPRIDPQSPRARPQPERPHNALLSRGEKAGPRHPRCEPVRARLLRARHLRPVVQQQRPPLPAHPHRRVDRAPVHLVNPPHAVRVAVVVEVPERPHPPIPGANVRLHVLQRQREPERPQPLPHMLRHPVLVIQPLHSAPPERLHQSPLRLSARPKLRPMPQPVSTREKTMPRSCHPRACLHRLCCLGFRSSRSCALRSPHMCICTCAKAPSHGCYPRYCRQRRPCSCLCGLHKQAPRAQGRSSVAPPVIGAPAPRAGKPSRSALR